MSIELSAGRPGLRQRPGRWGAWHGALYQRWKSSALDDFRNAFVRRGSSPNTHDYKSIPRTTNIRDLKRPNRSHGSIEAAARLYGSPAVVGAVHAGGRRPILRAIELGAAAPLPRRATTLIFADCGQNELQTIARVEWSTEASLQPAVAGKNRRRVRCSSPRMAHERPR